MVPKHHKRAFILFRTFPALVAEASLSGLRLQVEVKFSQQKLRKRVFLKIMKICLKRAVINQLRGMEKF